MRAARKAASSTGEIGAGGSRVGSSSSGAMVEVEVWVMRGFGDQVWEAPIVGLICGFRKRDRYARQAPMTANPGAAFADIVEAASAVILPLWRSGLTVDTKS